MPYPYTDNTDFLQEEANLKRRRDLLSVLQKQNLETPITGTSNGLAQALTQIAASYLDKKNQGKLDEQTQALSAARQSGLANELSAYSRRQNGMPEIAAADLSAGPPQDPSAFGAPAVKADPREAVMRAMASQHPELKAIGAKGYAEMQPQLKEINKRLVQTQFGQAPRVLADYSDPTVINQQAVRFDGDTPRKVGDFRDTFGPVGAVGQGPQGPIIGQQNTATGEAKFAPSGPVVNIDQKGEGAAIVAGGAKVPTTLEGARNAAIAAQNTLQSANRLEALAKDPAVITGFGANQLAGVAALSAKLGFSGAEGVSKTQALMAEAAKQTLANVHLLPGAITEKERPFLEMAASGKIDWTPEALQHLAGLSKAAAHNAIMDAKDQYFSTAKNFPGADKVAAMYPFPAIGHSLGAGQEALYPNIGEGNPRVSYTGNFGGAKPSAGGSVMTLEQYLKSRQGGQ